MTASDTLFRFRRSDLVADLAHSVFIARAAPGSKTEAFARKLLLTLDSPANGNLVGIGAEVIAPEVVSLEDWDSKHGNRTDGRSAE